MPPKKGADEKHTNINYSAPPDVHEWWDGLKPEEGESKASILTKIVRKSKEYKAWAKGKETKQSTTPP